MRGIWVVEGISGAMACSLVTPCSAPSASSGSVVTCAPSTWVPGKASPGKDSGTEDGCSSVKVTVYCKSEKRWGAEDLIHHRDKQKNWGIGTSCRRVIGCGK